MHKRTGVAMGAALVVVAVVAGALGRRGSPEPTSAATPPSEPAAAVVTPAPGRRPTSLADTITGLQAHLKSVPKDYPGWATLGIAYVQQAKITLDSDYYPKAEGVLRQSLTIESSDNFLAHAGLSALASARHDFSTAEVEARTGLALNPSSPLLYGALGDALVQLGRYDEADAAIDRMVALRPDTTSLARKSYLRELRGDIPAARALMREALDFAPTASDRAFALFQLGELDFNAGDANAALALYREALAASPDDAQALGGKAKAEAALGQHLTAIDDYGTVVARAPEPGVVLEFADLLQSLGRADEARAQYAVAQATQALFVANGVESDAAATLFAADHGPPAEALASGEAGIRTRPFLTMQDAYAWALHVNGRDAQAREVLAEAMAVGLPSALFEYHAGMIDLALGDVASARAHLTRALDLNPSFNPLAVRIARTTLDSLGADA